MDLNKKKKKILYFVESMGGGVFTYITSMANSLCNDFDMYVAYGIRPQTPQNFKSYFDKNVHLIEVKNFKRNVSISDFKAFFEMKKIKNKVDPDIIHLHSSKAGFLGRWAFRNSKIPIFYTPHGYSFLMSNISPIKKKIYKLLEKISTNKNCTIIACSYGEKIESEKLASNVLYVDNGINIKNIDNTLKGIIPKEGKKITIFTLGRISSQKDPLLFNKIAESFQNIKFVWIGDGEKRDVLTSPNITVTGWLNEQEALSQAINYDAFLLTSKWEGLPMALLEAMYLKKPCIVSNVIGNNDVINKNNGFLCDNLSDYSNAISNIISNTQALQIIKENAYKAIINHYNSDTMAEDYKLIYLDKL